MTVTYTLEVSRARFWGFPKLLTRWRGSIYRLMYLEMTSYLALYYMLLAIYRYVLPEENQKQFESISLYCREFTLVGPLTFVMGFYVTFVAGRWWQQYMNIPWPDRLCMEISAYVSGADERGRLIRRALARYANLLCALTFQDMVKAGLLTVEEEEEIKRCQNNQGTWFLPAHWFCQLAVQARKEGRIHDDLHLKSLVDDMMEFRAMCGTIWSYDWISVPLVYTQVVTIAVYSFFFASLFGQQFLLGVDSPHAGHSVDYYFPFFTVCQFCFYVGWLKVAESMICPFGEDDDDFELNWIIDRNVEVSYMLVDDLHGKHPILTRDMYWGKDEYNLPYNKATLNYKSEAFQGSTQAMDLSEMDTDFLPEMEAIVEDEEDKMERGEGGHDNEDDDARSVSTADSESSCGDQRRKRRGRLATLLLGASRTTLFSKSSSKRNMADRQHSDSVPCSRNTRSRDTSVLNLDASSVADVRSETPLLAASMSPQLSHVPEESSDLDSTGQRTLTKKDGQQLMARIRLATAPSEPTVETSEEDVRQAGSDSSTTPLFPRREVA